MKLHFVNIAPLFTDPVDEVVADLHELSTKGDFDETAFCFTLVPEGVPAYDKAGMLGKKFVPYRDAMHAKGLKAGMLVQATMGHGWMPDTPAAFQRFRRGSDLGYQYTFCPLDGDFQNYVFDAIRHLVSLRPDFLMVDDDFRMFTGRGGCVCPFHMAEFNRRFNTDYTAEALKEALGNDESLRRQFDDFQRDTLNALAKVIRRAIDDVDPEMPCTFCACAHDLHHAETIAETLANKPQDRVVRVNNGRYLRNNPQEFAGWLVGTCRQKLCLPVSYAAITEADTCPQNRYSTDASVMHANIALALLQGYAGAKLWITRLSDFQPASGIAYRKILGEHGQFYQAVRDLQPAWKGFNSPAPRDPARSLALGGDNWAAAIFCSLGLPFRVDLIDNGPTMLSSNDDAQFTDDEIAALLKGALILDGIAAERLAKRGFAQHLGFEAMEVPAKKVTEEHDTAPNGETLVMTASPRARTFVNVDPAAEQLSQFFHKPWVLAEARVPLGPGVVRFKNELGGTVVTFGAFIGDYSLESFFLLNETRKKQLCRILSDFGALPAYSVGDARVIFQVGASMAGDVCYLCNISNDIVENPQLDGPALQGRTIERLRPDGTWKVVATGADGGGPVALDLDLLPLHPVVLRY